MKINSISNLSFGRIHVAEGYKDRASEVFRSFRNESPEYDKTIDYIKHSDNTNIWIDGFEKVDYQLWEYGARVNTDKMAERKDGDYLYSFRDRIRFALDQIDYFEWRRIEKFSNPKENDL